MSSVISHLFGLLIARLGRVRRQAAAEILALRHQVRVLQRRIDRPTFTPADRTILAVLSRAFHRPRLGRVMLIELDQRIRRTTTCHGLINEYRPAT